MHTSNGPHRDAIQDCQDSPFQCDDQHTDSYDFPETDGLIHLIGIGGIGMRSLALLLRDQGWRVQGSDTHPETCQTMLEKAGITVFRHHDPAHIQGTCAIVHSSAVKEDNPEIQKARVQGIPIFHRAEALAHILKERRVIAVSGTHGKTTTTALIGHILTEAELDPLIVTGGIMQKESSTLRLGKGAWAVIEADESDGSFLRLPCAIPVLTNLSPEHLEHYATFENLKKAAGMFLGQASLQQEITSKQRSSDPPCDHKKTFQPVLSTQAWRTLICSNEAARDDRLQNFSNPTPSLLRPCVYSIEESQDKNLETHLKADNIRFTEKGMRFDLTQVVQDQNLSQEQKNSADITLALFGHHNVSNALAALGIAFQIGISPDVAFRALSTFSGVARRFTPIARLDDLQVIDDYAHHPREISATLACAGDLKAGAVVAVVQPHRFSRLTHLFADFIIALLKADRVFVLPVFAAGEASHGKRAVNLAASLNNAKRESGTNHALERPFATYCPDEEALWSALAPLRQTRGHLIFMGAGDITHIARRWVNRAQDKAQESYADSV